MKGKKPAKGLNISVPAQETPVDRFLTASGTFTDGELRLNQSGLRLISEENGDDCEETKLKVEDVQLSMDDLEMVQVIDIVKQVKTILEPYLAVLCKQILEGLLYLHHERHVIHRDIKPSNLLVNRKCEVKISDFGVSAVLASSMGQRDTFVGTYNYMAPERISGSSYDYKSDIWSLGLVILECAIGRFPYVPPEGEGWLSFYELLEAIVDQPPPSAPADQFSSEFCSFISSCIQKDPAERMSASELLNHPFVKKFEGKDLDLRTLVENLEPPMNISE